MHVNYFRQNTAFSCILGKIFQVIFKHRTVNMFLRHSIRYGIPFDLRLDIPNEETFAAIDDVNNNRNMSKTFSSVKDLMDDLNA